MNFRRVSWGLVNGQEGDLAATTATATKTSLENVTLRNFYNFAVMPLRRYVGTKFLETAFKWGSVLTFFKTTLNLVISHCYFAGDGKEMYKNINARSQ